MPQVCIFKTLIYFLKSLADYRDGLQACMCSEASSYLNIFPKFLEKENIYVYL